MEKNLLVKNYFLQMLDFNIYCARQLAKLVGAALSAKMMAYIYYVYIVAALEYEYLNGKANGTFKEAKHSVLGETLHGEIYLDEHDRVFLKTDDGNELEVTPSWCPEELWKVCNGGYNPVQWDSFFSPRAVCYASGIPVGMPDAKPIATPVFSIDLDTPAFTANPAQTLYRTLFIGMIPSQQEILALLEQFCLFSDENKYWFRKPVGIRLFSGAKKFKHVIYGICLDEKGQLAPMGKKGEPLKPKDKDPISIILEHCPAYVLADLFDAALHTAPLERYIERNRRGGVNCLKGEEAASEEEYQEKLEQYIKVAFHLLEQDMRYAKGHPEMTLLLGMNLDYKSWYPIIYHIADHEVITIQDGVLLQGFTRDCCPKLIFHGLMGYLPDFKDATTGFIMALLEGPLHNKLVRSARYYSVEPENFVEQKLEEMKKTLNETHSPALQWTTFIRCEGAGDLPADTDNASRLCKESALRSLERQIFELDNHVRMTGIDLECLHLHYIHSFIDYYGIDGRINVSELDLEDDSVWWAIGFRDAADLNHPGRVVYIRKLDLEDGLPRIEFEFERPLVRDDGSIYRHIITAGAVHLRMEWLYLLLLKIINSPEEFSIEKGVIHPLKRK